MSQYENDLIFGKDKTENIVSVEVKDDKVVLFIEKDGVVKKEVRDNQFWLLTNAKASSKQKELPGGQHYKYLAQFKEHSDWMQAKSACKKKNVDYYTMNESKEHYMAYNGVTYFKNMKPSDVSVLFFDIEGTGLTHNKNSKVLVITNVFRNHKGEIFKENFFLDDYASQAEMLEDWCNCVKHYDPSIIAVHNGFGYDLPYLQHVADLCGAKLSLGRNGNDVQFAGYTSQFRKDGSQSYEYHNCWIYGREIIDTFFLSIKYDFAREFPSYGLKQIIKHIGMEKKDRVFVDASKMEKYWNERKTNPEMWQRVKEYAMDDAEDLIKIYDMMLPSYFYFSQQVSIPLQQIINRATGAQVNNMMVRSYLQKGKSIAKADDREGFTGAISFGIPGLYKNVFKLDVASLYPSIIRQYKIYNKQKDPEANFLNIIETLTLDRLKDKKLAKETGLKYYKDLESSKKIVINSGYGFLGSAGLNYNFPEGASLVTSHGREILNKGVQLVTGKNVEFWKTKEESNEESEDEV
jgi:DNA polymerase elongation subunit (family B)